MMSSFVGSTRVIFPVFLYVYNATNIYEDYIASSKVYFPKESVSGVYYTGRKAHTHTKRFMLPLKKARVQRIAIPARSKTRRKPMQIYIWVQFFSSMHSYSVSNIVQLHRSASLFLKEIFKKNSTHILFDR